MSEIWSGVPGSRPSTMDGQEPGGAESDARADRPRLAHGTAPE
ncbi:hypothetical protein [Nocardia nova]